MFKHLISQKNLTELKAHNFKYNDKFQYISILT